MNMDTWYTGPKTKFRSSVKSLYEETIEVVSKAALDDVKRHQRSSCAVCTTGELFKCCVLDAMKKAFSLPVQVSQVVYNRVYAIWNTERDISAEKKTDLLSLLTWLLYSPQLKIPKFCLKEDTDFFFLIVFGKNVHSLFFSRNYSDLLYGKSPLWKSLFIFSNTIHTLNLEEVILSDYILEVVGQECLQLKVLEGIVLNDTHISPKLFENMCYRNQNGERIRNPCCDTLEVINICKYEKCQCHEIPSVIYRVYYQRSVQERTMDLYVPFLLANVSNLKSFGSSFDIQNFLQSRYCETIPETSLQNAKVRYVTLMLITLCPKLRELSVVISAPGSNIGLLFLRLFQPLEKLSISKDEYPRQRPSQNTQDDFLLCKEVLCFEWKYLKEFDCSYPVYTLNISTIAKYLICLEKLNCRYFVTAEWDERTHFKCLKSASFTMYNVRSISWARAFSNTIEELSLLKCNRFLFGRSFDEICLHIFATAHFPALEVLQSYSFKSNFDHNFLAMFTNTVLN